MGLIDSVAKPIIVMRSGGGVFVGGRWQESAPPEAIAMRAAVQPAKPTELLNFPEGQRTRGAIKLYSEAQLLMADVVTRRTADRILYEGQEWEVKETGKYEGFGLLAYKTIAILADPDEEPA